MARMNMQKQTERPKPNMNAKSKLPKQEYVQPDVEDRPTTNLDSETTPEARRAMGLPPLEGPKFKGAKMMKEKKMACGGKVKKMKSGGSVRGAGKATKGVRKCKMC